MRYVIADDEERALNLLKILLRRFEGFQDTDEIITFTSAPKALDYVLHNPVDILFLDIEMPVISGMELAEQVITNLNSPPEIIYVTAFPQYSLKAWEIGAFGYILKPYDPAQIYQVLRRFFRYHAPSGTQAADIHPPELPHMRCFPDFEVLINGSPISFPNKKSKELLALLVHNRGNWVDIEKITFSLLEEYDELSSKNYCRTILYRLKRTLSENGLDDIVESKYGKMRVNTDAFTCDYYEYLNGKNNLFQGEYMGEYTWAQAAQATMWNRLIDKKRR